MQGDTAHAWRNAPGAAIIACRREYRIVLLAAAFSQGEQLVDESHLCFVLHWNVHIVVPARAAAPA